MEQQSNGKAVASLVLGILSILCTFGGSWFLYGSIAGIVLGIIGIVLAVSAKKENPSGMATAGMVLSIVGVICSAIAAVACVGCIGLWGAGTAAGVDALNAVSTELYNL